MTTATFTRKNNFKKSFQSSVAQKQLKADAVSREAGQFLAGAILCGVVLVAVCVAYSTFIGGHKFGFVNTLIKPFFLGAKVAANAALSFM